MSGLIEVKSICIVCDHFIPDNKAISVRMKYLADAFIGYGIQTTVLTSSISKNVEGYEVSIVRAPVASNKDGLILRLIKELVFSTEVFFKVLFSSHELYFITSPPFTIALAAVFACRVSNRKYVFDVRDEYPEVYFTEGLVKETSLIGKLLNNCEKWIYKKAILVTTVTRRIKTKLEKKVGGRVPIYLLLNGYADSIKPSFILQKDKFIAVFHGNMGKFQHPELICKVAKLCKENSLPVEFRIYGWGSKSSVIKEAQKELDNIYHFGEVSHSEATMAIQQASIGLSFQGDTEISRNSFPSKVMEFIGTGIPVIVTPISEAGDFVTEHGVGYQFEPSEAELIFERIKFLVDNSHKMEEMRQNSLEIRAKLSRSQISKDFVKDFFQQ
jgi:glycosyltransferase involved in cell wall biosynthesis